jgi:hypothetical protein
MPSREKRQKTWQRGSTRHFLQCGLKARPTELPRFSAILAVMQLNFSATQTEWRCRQSGANLSLPKFPANREFNRESCKFWGPKAALLISKLYISEGNKRSGISPSREFAGMYQGIRIELSAMRAAKRQIS